MMQSLKAQVRHIAQVVSASHSLHSFSTNPGDHTKDYYKEIFSRLLLAQNELDHSIWTLQQA